FLLFAHVVVVDELHVELRADYDHGQAASAEIDLLADRLFAAENLLLEFESEDAHGRGAAVIALADESPFAGLAAFDVDERRRDAVDRYAAGHLAAGDDRTRLADRPDRCHKLVVAEVLRVFDSHAARKVRFRLLDAIGPLAGVDHQHVVLAEIFDSLRHRSFVTVHPRQ